MENTFSRIGFFRPLFDSIAYGRLYRYLCRMLWRYQLPCFEMLTLQEVTTLDTPTIVVAPWDLFANGGGLICTHNVKYILLIFEPLKNIEEWMEKRTKALMDENIVAYINLARELNPWFRKTFYGKPLFAFDQGYVEYEDGKILRKMEPVKEYDVIMPGHCVGPDRPEIVRQLRETGLVVADQFIVGPALDIFYPRAKVHAYYPYDPKYTAWHGQRTLWALNKGLCCVGVQSEDQHAEELYKGLYTPCTRTNFVATVKRIVQSGHWKQLGENAYDRYKRDFEAGTLFSLHLVSYFRFILKRVSPSALIPLFKVHMHADAIQLCTEVMQSGYLTQGPKVEEFESKLQNYFGVQHLTTVNSATTGLTLALRLLHDPQASMSWPGFDDEKDYVLTSPLTCTATNWSILANQYKLQWVDTQKDSPNICLQDLESKLTPNSKIIVFVHWGGIPVDLHALSGILDKFEAKHRFRPFVIEDCAHAFGSRLDRKLIGTHGNICVFSFQAIKHLTTGDGGMVIWPNEHLAQRARVIRWFGIDRDAKPTGSDFRNRESTDIPVFGYKWHMNDLNAAIGIGNLRNIQDIVHNHSENHLWLYKHISSMGFYKNIQYTERTMACGWVLTLLLPNSDARKRFMEFMTEHKIQTSQVHYRNDIHSCTFKSRIGSCALPNLDKFANRYVCIPCGWWLSESDLHHIEWALSVFAGQEAWSGAKQ